MGITFFSRKSYSRSALEKEINFIYASSAATYGNEEINFSEEQPIDRLTPINKYGFSKQLFDKWVFDHLNLWKQKIKESSPLVFSGNKVF